MLWSGCLGNNYFIEGERGGARFSRCSSSGAERGAKAAAFKSCNQGCDGGDGSGTRSFSPRDTSRCGGLCAEGCVGGGSRTHNSSGRGGRSGVSGRALRQFISVGGTPPACDSELASEEQSGLEPQRATTGGFDPTRAN